MPSWIGPWEIAIVLVLALLIFGPRKLPELGSSLGRSISGFKKGLKETKDDVQTAMKEDVTADEAEPAVATAQATSAEATVKTETVENS
jgi:sec-independent protein translocase protein TatA